MLPLVERFAKVTQQAGLYLANLQLTQVRNLDCDQNFQSYGTVLLTSLCIGLLLGNNKFSK